MIDDEPGAPVQEARPPAGDQARASVEGTRPAGDEPVRLRPMTEGYAPALADIVDAAAAAEARAAGREPPAPGLPERHERFVKGLARFALTDPDGAWVARAGGDLLGFGQAIRREGFWGLAMLFVHPDRQSRGIGRSLLDRCLAYAEGASVRMIMTSQDPRALRRYALAGLDIHPAVKAAGKVDRRALPSGLPGRDGDETDLDLVTAVDLPLRGASRAGDVGFLLSVGARMTVVDRGGRRGFVVVRDGNPLLLGADDPATAQALLWQAFAAAKEDADVDCYCWTAAQGWAVGVALAARLTVAPAGPLFVAGGRVPGPWLPSGWYF